MTVFFVFLAGYTLSQFYRSFLAVIAPELARDLALSPVDLSAMSSAWFAAFALAQFPVGWALDRFGPRRTVPLVMLAAVAGAVALAAASNRATCLFAMALIGIGCSPIYMGALYLFARTYPVARFAFLASLLLAIGSIGNLAGATPLAYAAETLGWRATFLGIAVLTLVALVLVGVLIVDPPRQVVAGDTGLIGGLRAVLSIGDLWPLLPLVFVSYAVVIAERALWAGPYFADVHGLGPIARGNALLVFAVTMSVGALVLGALDQPLQTRKWLVVCGCGMTAATFAALAWVPTPSVVQAIGLYGLLGLFGHTYGVLMAHGRSFLPEHLIGRGITLLNFMFIAGAGVVQIASGWLFEATLAASAAPAAAYAAIHGMFAAALLAAIVLYLFSEDRY